MDAAEISLSRLARGPGDRRGGALLLVGLGTVLGLVTGCSKPPRADREARPISRLLRSQFPREKGKPPAEQSSFSVETQGGTTFSLDDPNGLPILKASAEKFQGLVRGSAGLQGPVTLQQARCQLFEKGKPSMTFESPEAVWDGEHLSSEKTARAVMSDGNTRIESQKAVWTAATGALAVDGAELQGFRRGKVEFTATAPHADIVQGTATMPRGALGRNAAGQQLKGDVMRWQLRSGKLEADGHVVLTDTGIEVTGDRLRADTRLKKGRLTGSSRYRGRRLPAGKTNG